MISNFIIVEVIDSEITNDPCGLMTAFKYMVEDSSTGARWFGSNSRIECEEYISNL
jgi:hypothetical protein